MTYKKWFDTHAQKHKKIVDKLVAKGYTKEEIVDYFDFDNMVKQENNFCYLYKDNKKCHDIKELNCYLCACPNFRFNDDGLATYNSKTIKSKCTINNGKAFSHENIIHHDCSSCNVPHYKSYALKNFSYDWKEIMQKSPSKSSV